MLAWLDAHSGAVQAVTAIATLIVTAVLAWLTYRYVRLTSAIASAAVQQTRHMSDTVQRGRAHEHTALQLLAARLRIAVGELGEAATPDAAIRRFALFTAGDIDQLEALATKSASVVMQAYAMPAAFSLRFLHGLIGRVQATNPATGYAYTDKELAEYAEAVDTAIELLEKIRDLEHPTVEARAT